MLSRAIEALGRGGFLIGSAARIVVVLTIVAIGIVGASAPSSRATETNIEQMPGALETQFALSALPPALRDRAAVYLLDPSTGYLLSRPGTSGVTCLVERTAWEQADFRNDIYVPLCYDAEGTKTYLKVIMDVAALRIQGMSPTALKAEIENRYKSGTYKAAEKPGMSYMAAPVMRTWMNPDWNVHTMSVPHLMFYAPNLTNEDIGAVPSADRYFPFTFKEGIAEQTYIIHLVGEAEKMKIVANEQALLNGLCAYRDVLCLPGGKH